MVCCTKREIGDLLAMARQSVGLSQAEIAKLIPLTNGAIGQWERPVGRKGPTLESLDSFINALQLSVQGFFGAGTTSTIAGRLSGMEAEMVLMFRRLSDNQRAAFMNMLRAIQ